MSSTPIADHALLSDCHSAALVSRDGSVEWWCSPRFDSPSIFARLLDDAAGHWVVRPAGGAASTRRYLEGTMVLETTFTTGTGSVSVTDALAMGASDRGHQLGRRAPGMLIRRVQGIQGRLDMEVEFLPRTEYGLVWPMVRPVRGGVACEGGADLTVLSSLIPLALGGGGATGRFTITEGQVLTFAAHHKRARQGRPRAWSQEQLAGRLEDTVMAWRSWSALHESYTGPWRDLVRHSGRVLQALTYYPTGAIVAAPTTSLPETPGGSRNWDYRYSWVRDASLTMHALWVAACPDEATKFFRSMSVAAATSLHRGADLQIMFGVGGERDLTERTLPHLAGWRSSGPVRIGNDAWKQRQIDVYGELLAAVSRLREQLPALDVATREFLVAVADAAANDWMSQDQGIWEVRGPSRDFLYSKVMCWVALDRAIGLADLLGAAGNVARWRDVGEQIRDAVLTRGWSDKAGAFTQYFGSDELDASNLMMPIMGFLPATDPRMLATIDAIDERLTDGRGLVYRYRTETTSDGLEGDEGAFVLCTLWLAEALALAGQPERARAAFERVLVHVNDIGLLSEEVDGATGEMLGNFPQAFSHIGLINAAWAIGEAEARRPRPSTDPC